MDEAFVQYLGELRRLRIWKAMEAGAGVVDEDAWLDAAIKSVLSNAWRELLGVASATGSDNFFELGGDSLMMTHLLWRVRDKTPAQPSLTDLLRCPTFSEQVELFTSIARHVESESTSTLTVSRAQARRLLTVREATMQGKSARIKPCGFTLCFSGITDLDTLVAALSDLLNRHDALRTTFRTEGAMVSVSVTELDSSWRPSVLDLSDISRSEALREISEEVLTACNGPVDLSSSPIALVLAATLPGDEAVVGIVVDHIVADGYSMQILSEDLQELYLARKEGRAPRLLELPMPEQALVARSAERAEQDRDQRLDAWRHLFAGYPQPPTFELIPRPPVMYASRTGRSVYAKFSEDSAGVREFRMMAQILGVSALSVLVAATYLAVHRISGDCDIALVVPYLHRDLSGAERAVGWFADSMILRITDVHEGRPCAAPISRVISHVTSCINRSMEIILPLELILEALQSEEHEHFPEMPWLFCNYMSYPKNDMASGESVNHVSAVESDAVPETVEFSGIRVLVNEEDSRLDGLVLGARDLYPAETVNQLAENLHMLLCSSLEDTLDLSANQILGDRPAQCRCVSPQ